MSDESLNEFKALISGGGFIELTNGCCVDIDRDTENGLRAGPFSFYLQLEKYLKTEPDDLNFPGSNDPNLKLLRADSSTNSFIYGGEGRDVTP